MTRWLIFGATFFLLSQLSLIAQMRKESGSDAETVAAARDILDRYHADRSSPNERTLHVICWRPIDREFTADKNDRLTRILEHIQKFYADEMDRIGFGRRTFQLMYDKEKKLVIHEAVGSDKFASYKRSDGERVKNDCWPVLRKAGINPDREVIMIFTNLSDWDPVANTFTHRSPYYARGNRYSGIAWQLDSPEIDTHNLPMREPMISDGEYGRISLGKHNSIFIGGVAHELGHALGLPHCEAREDEARAYGTALMGAGNRTYFDQVRREGKGTFITLVHALRLASHPQFSGSVKGLNLPAKAEFSEVAVTEKGSGFVVRGKVESAIPVYAVIAYLAPHGGGDYDSRTVCAVPDSEGVFELDCFPVQRGKDSAIRIVALMANGATSTWLSSYRVSDDGEIDISAMKVTMDLEPFCEAVNLKRLAEARRIIDELSEGASKSIAQMVLSGYDNKWTSTDVSQVSAKAEQFPLSHVTPISASVGWQTPAYDHLPNERLLLVSGGECFKTGIYAHAPARHVYEFPESSDWKVLSGKYGLPIQLGGSVVFVIKADGKEVFRSERMKGDSNGAFEVDLNGVKTLELITEDAGDGNGADWGLWLGPMLKR